MTETEKVYITANPTPNPESMKFIVDRQLVEGDPVFYQTYEEASGSPLAEKLFELDGTKELFAFQNFVTVTKHEGPVWQTFAREIGQAIREHVQSGATEHFKAAASAADGSDDEKVVIIKNVLDEIRPMVARDGGNIVFAGYKEGVVQVFMQGSCSGCPSSTLTLKSGIERRLREELPELQEVVAI
jgi:Fe-S cluster biogenesis protein NfuA